MRLRRNFPCNNLHAGFFRVLLAQEESRFKTEKIAVYLRAKRVPTFSIAPSYSPSHTEPKSPHFRRVVDTHHSLLPARQCHAISTCCQEAKFIAPFGQSPAGPSTKAQSRFLSRRGVGFLSMGRVCNSQRDLLHRRTSKLQMRKRTTYKPPCYLSFRCFFRRAGALLPHQSRSTVRDEALLAQP